VQQIDTGDGLKLDTQVAQLVAAMTAMTAYSANNPNFNPATATMAPSDTSLQNAITVAWHQ
jgi:hypothetical protein